MRIDFAIQIRTGRKIATIYMVVIQRDFSIEELVNSFVELKKIFKENPSLKWRGFEIENGNRRHISKREFMSFKKNYGRFYRKLAYEFLREYHKR